MRNDITDEQGINPTIRQTGPLPCQRRDMFERGSHKEPAPEETPGGGSSSAGLGGEAGRAAAIAGSKYQTQKAGCCVLSRENGLDRKMKLSKPNYQCNQITAVKAGPLNWGWRGLGRELPFQLCSCEHLGVHIPALLPLSRQDKEAQFRHQLFFKASSVHRKDHLCRHWPTEVI